MRTGKQALVVAMIYALALSGCSEVNRKTTPVLLVATTHQDVTLIDLLNPPTTSLGTINLQAIQKRSDVTNTTFLDVQLKSYRVSYQRTDGGKTIPQPFVRTTSGLVAVGTSLTPLNDFQVFELGALQQAPFAALYPNNGGVDPETGKTTVSLDVIVDIFGETLGGENVAARTSFPLTFCAGCT